MFYFPGEYDIFYIKLTEILRLLQAEKTRSPAPERMGSPAPGRIGSPAPERMARPGSAMRAAPGRLLQEERTRAEISKVYFSAVAPRTFKKNEYTMVHLAMYEKEFRNIVDEIKADYDTDVKETKSGALKVTAFPPL